MENLLINSSSSLHHNPVHRRLFCNQKNTSNQIDRLLPPKSLKFDKPIKPFVVQSSLNMKTFVSKVAVIGSGVSGAVCASSLAKHGVSVTVFDSGRGPGGRTSQRRETAEDGKELVFDHGAPYFTVTDNNVMDLVHDWETRGFVAEWKESFGSFDCATSKFVDFDKEGSNKKFVGIPGMNSICRTMCREPGVDSKFGVTIGSIKWLEDKNAWLLTDLNGQPLGHFDGLVTSDKNIVSPRSIAGRPPLLDMTLFPELAVKLKEIPVISCFALMLAFSEPLSSIPVRGVSFKNSEVLSRAFCDSSKPGRAGSSERWVLHSTGDYAKNVISQNGLQKPSTSLLTKVADELFSEFQSTGLQIPKPFFMKAHRWGGAFPATSIAGGEEKCLWDGGKRLAICGDFCVSPNIEGAILSGTAAAAKFMAISSSF